MLKRIFVEKKPEFAVEAGGLLADLKNTLGINALTGLRIVNRYDISDIGDEQYLNAKRIVLSEPPVDFVYDERIDMDSPHFFISEYLPGQYDQRADSAAQCIQIITGAAAPTVRYAKVYILYGELTAADIDKIKAYCINPVESREASADKPLTLEETFEEPADVAVIEGFTAFTAADITEFRKNYALAMSEADIAFCQDYFIQERRNPTITEIRVLDTYWSDHCRHTTFNTKIEQVDIVPQKYTFCIQEAYDNYLADRDKVYGDNSERIISLMDIAVMGMKSMRKQGLLDDLDSSDEINACSIVVPVTIDGHQEEWLIMFKNETHNHPTEIEPFGGAATCLGGSIRDPLSGRAYVYQAMRITGSGNPLLPIGQTLPGKLPQRKITLGAAAGYSSYGNQIGLATGYVKEYYHDKFVAKRMEVGAVIGAAPRENVIRQVPAPGDAVILLGGKTGRDGCGGATGSSKEHDLDSLTQCGAEVQKGNAPTERKIQRMFRNPQVTKMIKRCNDFGAGGVSVAIGELTDSLEINLDTVPKKYAGLDGTELAISESQERMAIVVAQTDAAGFIEYAQSENLEATVVATVTDTGRLIMKWRGQTIVDLAREFLNTNGVTQTTNILVEPPAEESFFEQNFALDNNIAPAWLKNLKQLNVCSQKGLVERFDSTIGAGTVLMPFGGKYQLTPAEGMVAKVPTLQGTTTTATVMTCGYNPEIACWSPYHGGMFAVVESVARAVALGVDPDKIRLTLQEYFEKLVDDAAWGKPFAALLGAYTAQNALAAPAIGGKDSMSGTFMDKTVPPTLISFAVGIIEAAQAVSSEFKQTDSTVIFIDCPRNEAELVDFTTYKAQLRILHQAIVAGKVRAAATVKAGGIAAAVTQMCLGNKIGFKFNKPLPETNTLFVPNIGSFIVELAAADLNAFADLDYMILGYTTAAPQITINTAVIELEQALTAWTNTLEPIFPNAKAAKENTVCDNIHRTATALTYPGNIAKPRVIIPVFPGTNCEYDSQRAFERAGAAAATVVIKNYDAQSLNDSIHQLAQAIKNSQILMLPGGFSAGDEPEGSAKFIAALFRNPYLQEATMELLEERQGLILGICNGFQALIKLGLLPYGKIMPMRDDSPTLTYNNIGRHISTMANTKVVSNLSPWLALTEPGDIHTIAFSHGEGKFVATEQEIAALFAAGQVCTQYVDLNARPTMQSPYNPNGSLHAIESICSPDGRIFGKMGHSERYDDRLLQNIQGNKDQQLFVAGVRYFN